MVGSIKTLQELLTKLFRERKEGKRQTFITYATPLYEGSKTVFDDYLGLFSELKKKALESSLRELLEMLDERRHSTLSIRHELRAYIADFRERQLVQRADLPAFEKAILAILGGAFEVAHSLGHFRSRIYRQIELEEAHTLSNQPKPPRTEFLNRLDLELDFQMKYLEAQFQVIAREYASMRSEQAPHKLKRRKSLGANPLK
jgi:hypothetical protein